MSIPELPISTFLPGECTSWPLDCDILSCLSGGTAVDDLEGFLGPRLRGGGHPEKCKAPGLALTARPGARDTDGDWQIRLATDPALTSALPFGLSSLGRGHHKAALASAYASAPSLRLLSIGMDHLLSSVGAILRGKT